MDTSVDIITVMFADVAGSTTLYEQLGDEVANTIIHDVIDLMSEVTAKNSGTVVKTIGDEVMCRFSKPDHAFTTASVIQEMLQNRPKVSGVKVRVRIGMHTGQALIRQDGDVFGDAVNVAARVTAIAKGNQIITTQDTVNALSPIFMNSCREIDRIPLKGKSEETVLCEVLLQSDDLDRNSTMINFIDNIPSARQLHLSHQGNEFTLNPEDPALTLGRGEQCDVMVNTSHASRAHARIEFRRGKFVIIDQSTNGTFVKGDDGNEVYLRREALPLMGAGVISLGVNTDQEDPHQIHFSV
ncbi:MAG: FHA domain-containing protein [Gammaproteobacteria bacterium]|nr:FHA domain-containing protein [Gammaproteobacteria bacterium]